MSLKLREEPCRKEGGNKKDSRPSGMNPPSVTERGKAGSEC